MRLKRLIRVGNSLALVIDSPTLRMLGIERRTELRVWLEDGRLLLEPHIRIDGIARRMRARERALREQARVFDELLKRNFEFQAWERLSGKARMGYYGAAVASGDDVDPLIAKRLAACLTRLEAGDSWEAAVDGALARHPGVPRDHDDSAQWDEPRRAARTAGG